MNRMGIGLVAALVVGAVILIVSKSGGDGGEDAASEKETELRAGKSGGDSAKSTRQSNAPEQSLRAATQLRTMLTLDSLSAPEFGKVDAMARRLSDEDLQNLIGELSFAKAAEMEGWVRNALYAEWGRRDPEAATASLRGLNFQKDVQRLPVEQAWFGLYRGWAESDPTAALAQLEQEPRIMTDAAGTEYPGPLHWMNHAYEAVFAQMAAQNPEMAWTSIPENSERRVAMEGFFAGLNSKEEVLQYAKRWEREWGSEEARKAHEEHARQLKGARSTGAIALPNEEVIASAAALALANFDLTAAEEWLVNTGPGDEQDRARRRDTMVESWARQHPEDVLEILAESEHRSQLARGAILADPTLATEVVSRLEDPGERIRALQSTMRGLANRRMDDYFPAPGQRDEFPNFEESYQSLLEAVAAGDFEERQALVLQRGLHMSFQAQVPAAREAFREMTGR